MGLWTRAGQGFNPSPLFHPADMRTPEREVGIARQRGFAPARCGSDFELTELVISRVVTPVPNPERKTRADRIISAA
jgi:hypothetical protein